MIEYLITLLKIDFYEYCANISIEAWTLCWVCSFVAILGANKYYWRKKKTCVHCITFSVFVTFVLGITLLGRENGMASSSFHTLFWTYERAFIEGALHVACEILFNALLFFPIGICLFGVISSKMVVKDILLFSMGIEIVQLITGRGVFELADIINNVLGGICGIFAMSMLSKYRVYCGRKNGCSMEKLY